MDALYYASKCVQEFYSTEWGVVSEDFCIERLSLPTYGLFSLQIYNYFTIYQKESAENCAFLS